MKSNSIAPEKRMPKPRRAQNSKLTKIIPLKKLFSLVLIYGFSIVLFHLNFEETKKTRSPTKNPI
jgi:quinol-cytochrome oxidoreductase complex cytochrome b subunit